ncbi:hypothetical protein OEA41_002266 [Lepraria neglecta]|uniref:Uncharacterized protein n=1 Tax=Lepraria neglecta TaxID=209136 RepID=A0AAE0DMK9_9LECA|nr:hypothetical protein OEA41_002266 [Lepraria neglecta]
MVELSARSANVELLKLLIRHNGDRTSIPSAIPEAMKIAQSSTQLKIINLLLDHGAYGLNVDQALVDATRLGSDEVALIQLLLKAKASTGHRGGKALSNVVKFCSKDIVHSIITKAIHQQSHLATLPCVFNPATQERREKAELVIQGSIDKESINKALIHELSNGKSIDHNMAKMLLRYKANCDYDHGKALDLAIESGDSALLQLLLASPPNPRLLAQKILVAMQITERK